MTQSGVGRCRWDGDVGQAPKPLLCAIGGAELEERHACVSFRDGVDVDSVLERAIQGERDDLIYAANSENS
jgi:hypothetical protein